MAEIIDISPLVHTGIPAWPGSPGMKLHWTKRMATGERANVSRLDTDVHVGAHIDAPLHFLADGGTVDQIPLEKMIGAVLVVGTGDAPVISADVLESLAVPAGTRRLLCKTRNSALWSTRTEFTEDYTALTADAAQWVVERGVDLVGIDYLSIQLFHDPPTTHHILLRADVVILEGLDLSGVAPGEYELLCLPLNLGGAEGAPVRAVLRKP